MSHNPSCDVPWLRSHSSSPCRWSPPLRRRRLTLPFWRARELQKQVPLIDGHNDYPWALRENAGRDLDKLDITKPQPTIMTDIARLRAGGVGGQFWSVYVSADDPAPVTTTLEQIDIVHRMMRTPRFELALTADDVERIFKKGKIASLIGMEGGHSIDSPSARCACSTASARAT